MTNPRWVNKLRRHYYHYLQPRYIVANRMGVRLLLDQTSLIDQTLLATGVWESARVKRLFNLADERLPPGEGRRTFLDIGAHAGLYAILFARHGGGADDLILVEPDPENRAQLQANLFLNNLAGRARVCEWAASDRNGPMQFHVGPSINRGSSRVELTGSEASFGRFGAFDETIEIQARRLDDELALNGGRLAIKMDVECHELRALDGMRRILAANQCVAQVEIDGPNIPAALAFFQSLDYENLGSINNDFYFSNVARDAKSVA